MGEMRTSKLMELLVGDRLSQNLNCILWSPLTGTQSVSTWNSLNLAQRQNNYDPFKCRRQSIDVSEVSLSTNCMTRANLLQRNSLSLKKLRFTLKLCSFKSVSLSSRRNACSFHHVCHHNNKCWHSLRACRLPFYTKMNLMKTYWLCLNCFYLNPKDAI